MLIRHSCRLLVLLLGLAVASVPIALVKSSKNTKTSDELTKIYVFYSEPPFAYETTGEIRVRLLSIWDRDRMEQEIREQTAKAGGDVVILARSAVELNPELRPVRKGPFGSTSIKVPDRTAYVEGHVGTKRSMRPSE